MKGCFLREKKIFYYQQQSFKGEPNVELGLYQPWTLWDSKGCWENLQHAYSVMDPRRKSNQWSQSSRKQGFGENPSWKQGKGLGFSFLFPIYASEHSAINLELYFCPICKTLKFQISVRERKSRIPWRITQCLSLGQELSLSFGILSLRGEIGLFITRH